MASIDGISLIGRPSKYRVEYCEQLISHMEQGFSYESFAAIISVGVATIYVWEKEHEEFREAKSIGVAKCNHWNEVKAKEMVEGLNKDGKPAVLIFKMKNQNKWKDGEDKSNANDDEKNEIKLNYSIKDI